MIVTKYLPPTNTMGGRVKATSGGGASLTLPWDHSLNPSDNHREAMKALAQELDMPGIWHFASHDGGGYTFIRDTPTGWIDVPPGVPGVCEGRR